MESWFCSCWMLAVLLGHIPAEPDSPPDYVIHNTSASFDQAVQGCSPGVLTTLATAQELANILMLISSSPSPVNQKEFNFWVGLRKVKNECVVPTLPLKGFRWVEDGSEESEVSRWIEEPKPTCITARCVALKGELAWSTVTRWGLSSVTCKSRYQFICKRRKQVNPTKEAAPQPEPQPTAPEPQPPAPEPQPTTPEPQPTAPEPEPPTRQPATNTETTLETGPDAAHGPGPAQVPDSCKRPTITGARSFSLDPSNSSSIQVECWSSVQVELRCWGRPAVWRLLDGSPVNLTSVCQPCDAGFHKNLYGTCEDVDECSGGGASCRQTCVNTLGSFRCVCSDANGTHHDEDSQVCMDAPVKADIGWMTDVMTLVLIVVAALVVLVVVLVVVVRCCFIRRSKNRAMKKAEKMAMKSKEDRDSWEKAAI